MSNLIEHKGYYGTVEFSSGDNVLYGKVLGIDGLISYEGNSVQELMSDFIEAVEDYLKMCADEGIEPQRTYRGKFNVRVSPELHRTLAKYSASHVQTLNSAVEEAIRRYVAE